MVEKQAQDARQRDFKNNTKIQDLLWSQLEFKLQKRHKQANVSLALMFQAARQSKKTKMQEKEERERARGSRHTETCS